jgi:hypothetical protein
VGGAQHDWPISYSDLTRSHCEAIKKSMHNEWPRLDFCPSSAGSSWLVTCWAPIVSLFVLVGSVIWFFGLGFFFCLFFSLCFLLFHLLYFLFFNTIISVAV